ncbi:hypothetical protein CDAR_544471 [Caerostris darwini]|uniref:Secreted protein n=1 Tax=Caerostris darwini TaxID=1538125 RepID=A0AAV4TE40_9ARAC|nr:hypothetical protein CDAR_544471 [Caerostris darwini]
MRAIFHLPLPVLAMAFHKKEEQLTRTTGQKSEIGEGPPLWKTEQVSLTVDSCLEHFDFVFASSFFPPCTPGRVTINTEKKGHKMERKREKNSMGTVFGD